MIKSHMIMLDSEQLNWYLEQVLGPKTKFVMDSLLLLTARVVFKVISRLDKGLQDEDWFQ